MIEIKQSTASTALVFFMRDSTDHVTGKTGLSPTVLISKNGGTFATPAGSVAAMGNGFYYVVPNTADTNTLGILALTATAAGADQATMAFAVVANLESDTYSRLAATPPDATAIQAAAAAALTAYDPPTRTEATADKDAVIAALPGAAPTTGEIRTELATELGRIDVAVSSRNATTPPDSTAIQAAAAAALTAYDPPTRAEATSDKAEVLAVLGTPVDDIATDISNVSGGGGGGGDATEANQLAIIETLAGADQILLASLYTPSESPEVLLPVPSDDGDLCQVFFDSELGTGVPRAGTRVVFRLQGKGILRTVSGKFVDREEVIELTDETGRVTVALEKGLSWTAESETLFGPGGLSFTVPDADGYNLNTMEEV